VIKKVPFNTGMIVAPDGKILCAWYWGGDSAVKNPCACEQHEGECVELTKEEHDSFHAKMHLHIFDHKLRCVINKESGQRVCKIKSAQGEHVRVEGK